MLVEGYIRSKQVKQGYRPRFTRALKKFFQYDDRKDESVQRLDYHIKQVKIKKGIEKIGQDEIKMAFRMVLHWTIVAN